MSSRESFTILYTGAGVTGCMTSARCIAGRAVPPVGGFRRADAGWQLSWPRPGGVVAVHLGVSEGRSLYRFDSLKEAMERLTGPPQERFEKEVAFLRAADGIVFVADSQTATEERNADFLRRTKRDLSELGRSPEEVPIVFQLNKRDLPDVHPVERMKTFLGGAAGDYVESVATRGIGVADALDRLIDRIESGR